MKKIFLLLVTTLAFTSTANEITDGVHNCYSPTNQNNVKLVIETKNGEISAAKNDHYALASSSQTEMAVIGNSLGWSDGKYSVNYERVKLVKNRFGTVLSADREVDIRNAGFYDSVVFICEKR